MSPREALDRALAAALPSPAGARIGAAVSGGGDSMALMILLADWAARTGASVAIASVDHGLRAGAQAECAVVAEQAAALGVPHETLSWADAPGKGNLQSAARTARYALLAGWARRHGIGHVCLGHTLDDQAETLLMRLARGSGVDGLAAMDPARPRRDGVVWLRPLLDVARADLRDVLRQRDAPWTEDPSNDDPRFDRVRARRVLAELAPLGLNPDRLGATAQRMQAARQVLAMAAAQAAQTCARVEAGDIVLDRTVFLALPDETRWRLFAGALRQVSGAPYKPRFDALKRVLEILKDGGRTTLHGCLCRAGATEIRIGRELAAAAGPTPVPGCWDGRWQIVCPDGRGIAAGPLGEVGLAARPRWRDARLPRDTLLVSPALWRDDHLDAALLLDNLPGCHASLIWTKDDFVAFLLSD